MEHKLKCHFFNYFHCWIGLGAKRDEFVPPATPVRFNGDPLAGQHRLFEVVVVWARIGNTEKQGEEISFATVRWQLFRSLIINFKTPGVEYVDALGGAVGLLRSFLSVF